MKFKLLLFIFVLFNLVPLVSAQYYYDSSYSGISTFTFPFFDLSVGSLLELYDSYHQFWDFLLSLALLIAVFSHTIEDKLGRQTPVILAIILSIGFVSFERKFNFNIGDLGPIAVLVFLLCLLIGVLYLIKWIWGQFSENKGSSILSLVLFIIALLVIAVLFLKDTGKMPDLSDGQKILGLGILAALGYLLFLAYKSGWFSSSEKPDRPGISIEEPDLTRARRARETAEEPGASSEKPSLFSRIFSETPDSKEYKKISLLVSAFIENTKDSEFKEDFILRRYNSTQNYIKSFVIRFPKSKYLQSVNELIAQLNKALEDYISFKQNREQIEQNINYLDSLLNNEDEPIENLEKAHEYITAFYSEYKRQIQADNELSARLNSLITRLNQRISRVQKAKLNARQISQEQLNRFKEVSPQSFQQLKQELSEEQLSKFQQEIIIEESQKFEPVEKRVRGFFSSAEDFLDGRMSREDFSNLHQQTQTMLSKYIDSAQPTKYKDKAEQYQEDVKNTYNTALNEYINLENKKRTLSVKKEKHEITEELEGAQSKLNYAIKNSDKIPLKDLIQILKDVEEIIFRYYTEDYNPFSDSLNQLNVKIAQLQKQQRTSISPVDKAYMEREVYQVRSRLNRIIKNQSNISLENLQTTLNWAEKTLDKYPDIDIDAYSRESYLLAQLKNIINKRKRTSIKPTEKTDISRELSELRSTISRAISNIDKLTVEQVSQTIAWAEKTLDKYSDIDIDSFSEESRLINELKVKLAQKGISTTGILGKIKEQLIGNISTLNNLKKEAKKLSDSVKIATKENKSLIIGKYNQLIANLNIFSNKTKGRFDKKVDKLKNQIINEVALYRNKIKLQDLINDLGVFVNSIGRGDIPIIQAKKTYAETRRKFTEIEESSNRDELKQGLDIAYNLIKTVYSYVNELSNINLIEHEIDRIRDQIRKRILTADEGKKERYKLISRLENLPTNFKVTQIRKSSLLGELRSGY